ncbi:MAG TPA: DUF1499 domain-containing protein [Limnobacter sp.]|nr:DUF1499 domain-containing protein [Limnobacter sp.]
MKRALLGLVVLVVTVTFVFLGMGLYSGTGTAKGLTNGQLLPCPDKPNCVSSESAPSDRHSIAAIELTDKLGEQPLMKVKEVIELLGGKVSHSDEHYLASTFTSALFGFVDDVEFRLDREKNLLHVRSASRVGYSDLGANRKRVEQIRQLLAGQ